MLSPRTVRRMVVAPGIVILLALGVHIGWGWPDAVSGATAAWRLGHRDPGPTSPYVAPTEPPLVRVVAAGDIGTADAAARATAGTVDGLESSGELAALLLLGDNIYPDGDPARAPAAVFGPYGPVLDGGTALVAALGNHDIRFADGGPQMRTLGMPGRWYVQRFGPLELVVLDSNRADDPEQLAWLERTLAASRPPWRVVMQHHPPYSAGYHGSHEPSRRSIVPLLERYGADLVLAGHDHDYQRSTPQNGIVYVVSGGASTLRPTGRDIFTAASASLHHVVELLVYADRIDLRAVATGGSVIDQITISPRHADN